MVPPVARVLPATGDSVAGAPPVTGVDPAQVRRELLLTGLLRSYQVIFETARSEVLPYSHPILDAVGRVMTEIPEMRIRVEGHTDPRGAADYNMDLSRHRAESVRRYLIDRIGIEGERLEAAGLGEERLLVAGASPTAHALNRRVEFRVLNLGELTAPEER
jgi:outer membrane protein OmpA-like peptidoglycan-associated protein